jgi:cell division protein FtsL
MENLPLIVLVAAILVSFGVLIGCTFSARALDARERRQAAVQRSLNEQWQELQAARETIVH